MALEGDSIALRLCLDRITPPTKERPIEGFSLPCLNDSKSILDALGTITRKLANGELLPSEAKALCHLLDKYHQYYETTELVKRLEELEKRIESTK